MSEEKFRTFVDTEEGPVQVQDQGFTIKDSGERTKFESGMVRDVTEGKTSFWRVFEGPMFKRWAEHLTKGAKKYKDVQLGRANWTLAAGPEELHRFRDSALRHFLQWFNGDIDEDHAAAVFFNINGAEYVKGKIDESERRAEREREHSDRALEQQLRRSLAELEQRKDDKSRTFDRHLAKIQQEISKQAPGAESSPERQSGGSTSGYAARVQTVSKANTQCLCGAHH